MKPRRAEQRNHALTLVEAMVIIVVLGVLAVMILKALSAAKFHSRISCRTQLKEIGLSFQVWQGDNRGRYPMEVSTNAGGAMEPAATGNVAAVFLAMSNELSTPKILVCPQDDEHTSATNFNTPLTSKNISYYVGLDASVTNPNSILAGDSNLERSGRPITPGLYALTADTMFFWSATRHNRTGNMALVDGSVLNVANRDLIKQFNQTTLATNRLIIP